MTDGLIGRARLVAATRELMQSVGTTDLPESELTLAAERLERLVPELRSRSRLHAPTRPYEEAVGADCYDAAAHNPGLVPIDLTFAGGRASARVVLDSLYEGPRDSVHGGVISYLMDTLLACLVQQQGHLCVTASLTLDYRARTPLRAPLDLEAHVSRVRPRSVEVVGTIAHHGEVTVEARGLFVVVASR